MKPDAGYHRTVRYDADQFSQSDTFVIRVNPTEPALSLVRDEDQVQLNQS
jgi:hypothetical protein